MAMVPKLGELLGYFAHWCNSTDCPQWLIDLAAAFFLGMQLLMLAGSDNAMLQKRRS